MGGTGPLPAGLNGRVGAGGCLERQGRRTFAGTHSGACLWGTGRWSVAHRDGFLDKEDGGTI